jgi:hypothetical protein
MTVMNDEINQRLGGKSLSAFRIALALVIAFLPAVLICLMFTTFRGRNVPTLVIVAEGLFSLACCSAPSLLVMRRHPMLALLIALLFIPINGLIAFCFGCNAMLSAK